MNPKLCEGEKDVTFVLFYNLAISQVAHIAVTFLSERRRFDSILGFKQYCGPISFSFEGKGLRDMLVI